MTPLDTAPDIKAVDLILANEAAQAAFRDMLILGCQWNPDAIATRAYIAAERAVDDVLRDIQWEASKAELDRMQAGDHFLMPHSEHAEVVEDCFDCQEAVAATWADVMAPY